MDKIDDQTFTITFGDRAENHKSMQIIGNKIDEGLNIGELKSIKKYFESLGTKCSLINLKSLLKNDLDEDEYDNIDNAYLLIISNGTDALLGKDKRNELYLEQEKLKKDTKAFMYGKVVNKKARHNLCFSDFAQDADYENGKGTVVKFTTQPILNKLRKELYNVLKNDKMKKLQAEGNYYYDVDSTYIGFHGDSERMIVIAVRLGAKFPIHYQWYYKGMEIGKRFKKILKHGDIYFMSEKATGNDWKRSNIYTLRHAAGFVIK
jgi:hypothetical protein